MDMVQPLYRNHLNAKVQVRGDGGCRMLMLHYAVVFSFLMPVALFRAKKYTLIRRKHINAASTATAAVATAAAAVTYLIMSTSLLINVISKAS